MAHVRGDKKKIVETAAHAAKSAMKGPGPHGPMMERMMEKMPDRIPMMHGVGNIANRSSRLASQ